MALSGRREGAEVLRERIGPNARYSTFVPPEVSRDTPRPEQTWTVGRLLWGASLLSLAVVLVLAALVAAGF
jgi:hypothetical protein